MRHVRGCGPSGPPWRLALSWTVRLAALLLWAAACADASTEIACSDAVGGSPVPGETISIPVSAGGTYFVMVDGVSPVEVGEFQLMGEL